MRSSRARLYLQRLGELAHQFSELEDLRGLVEEAERRARGALASRPRRHASCRLRGRSLGPLSASAATRHKAEMRELSCPLRRTTKPIGHRLSHFPTNGVLKLFNVVSVQTRNTDA